MESIINQLKDRFSDKVKLSVEFEILLPKQCFEKGIQDERFLKLFEVFSRTLVSNNLIFTQLQCQSHYHKWVYRWQREYAQETSPSTLVECLNLCNSDVYPSISALLEIGSILPVSTATVERSFSTLRLLKNYLRNSISEDRLNGLALMSVYSEMPIHIDSVINRFASSKNRKLLLL